MGRLIALFTLFRYRTLRASQNLENSIYYRSVAANVFQCVLNEFAAAGQVALTLAVCSRNLVLVKNGIN